MANPFIHVELQTHDRVAAHLFYQRLLEWRFEAVPGMTYVMIDVGEGTGGGVVEHRVPGAASRWLPFIYVADVAACTRKAASLGARISQGPTKVPGYGWYSVISDPTGAAFGIWDRGGAGGISPLSGR